MKFKLVIRLDKMQTSIYPSHHDDIATVKSFGTPLEAFTRGISNGVTNPEPSASNYLSLRSL